MGSQTVRHDLVKEQEEAAGMGPTVFWGLRLWTEFERALPAVQARLPGEPAPTCCGPQQGREEGLGFDPQAQLPGSRPFKHIAVQGFG